jgi:hypothetical protein
MLARTVSQLEAKPGYLNWPERALMRLLSANSLSRSIARKVCSPQTSTSDELSVKALSQEVQRQNHVSVTPDASVVRHAPFSDAVSVLAQDRPAMGIVYGQGGARGSGSGWLS